MLFRLLLTLLLFTATIVSADTHELKLVKQVFDINAKKADEMYQFKPDFMQIETGDTVKFLGTVGRHTVHSVPGMMPEGAKKIAIMPHRPNEVTFTLPGVYGLQCKLHQRHGMVAVIVVGNDVHNIDKARENVSRGISQHTVDKMFRLLDTAEQRAK